MININLVPLSSRKKTGAGLLSGVEINLPRELLLGVGGGAVALMILIHVFLFGVLIVKGIVLAVHKTAWAKVLPDKNNIDALGGELKELKQKMNGMSDAVAQKATGWSRRLNIISDSVGRGLWLTQITVEKNVLTIVGCVVSKNQNEVVTVGAFVANIKKDEQFLSDLSSIEVDSVVRGKMGPTDVATFKITAKLK